LFSGSLAVDEGHQSPPKNRVGLILADESGGLLVHSITLTDAWRKSSYIAAFSSLQLPASIELAKV